MEVFVTEEELKAAQTKLAEDTAALEAEKEKLKNVDDTELQAQLKANATTIEALTAKLKAKKVDKTKAKDENVFDVEKFKAEMAESMATTVAELVTSGLTAANTATKEQELIAKIKEVDKDFDSEGFTTVTLEKYHTAITKKAKVNVDLAAQQTQGIFTQMKEGEQDPMLTKSIEMRAKAAADAKKAKEGK